MFKKLMRQINSMFVFVYFPFMAFVLAAWTMGIAIGVVNGGDFSCSGGGGFFNLSYKCELHTPPKTFEISTLIGLIVFGLMYWLVRRMVVQGKKVLATPLEGGVIK